MTRATTQADLADLERTRDVRRRELDVLEALEKVAVTTREAAFFNRFGQLVYAERGAGLDFSPRLSTRRSSAVTAPMCTWALPRTKPRAGRWARR